MVDTFTTTSPTAATYPALPAIDGPYRIGSTKLYLISDGLMKLIGRAMFRTLEQIADQQSSEKTTPAQASTGRTLVGLNTLLIQTGTDNILIDTGIGDKPETFSDRSYEFELPRKLLANLAQLNLHPGDVTHVINSHLHFDHCGGNTHYNRDEQLEPTFPNAIYHISRSEFEYARDPSPRERRDFPTINFLPLLETDQLELWDRDSEILPGISIITTGGHTLGHAVILIQSHSESACFLADLIPTASHLHPSLVMKADQYPAEVKLAKRELLQRAARENWLLLFDHAPRIKAGRASWDGQKFLFHPEQKSKAIQ